MQFIEKYITERLQHLVRFKFKLPKNDNRKKHFAKMNKMVVPYQPVLFENICKILRDHNILPIPMKLNKNDTVIKNKNITPKAHVTNVVYQLDCNGDHNQNQDSDHSDSDSDSDFECSASYIGETKRDFPERIGEHRRCVDGEHVIGIHKIAYPGHDFDYNNAKILHRESKKQKRLIAEMIHISMNENLINEKSDTKNLQKPWLDIIDLIKKLPRH